MNWVVISFIITSALLWRIRGGIACFTSYKLYGWGLYLGGVLACLN